MLLKGKKMKESNRRAPTVNTVISSYSSVDADYAEIPDEDEDADYAHPMAGKRST